MPLVLNLEIEGESFGEILLKEEWCGTAFFCPTCARIWAKATAPGVDTMPLAMSCAEHPRFPGFVAGSVEKIWDYEWRNALSQRVLNREVLMHIRHREHYDAA